MELVRKNIHMDFTKAKAVTQLVLEEDMNLPDVKPDIDCICLEKGNVIIDEAKTYADGVTVRGRLLFHVLYHTDEEEHALATVEGKIPFEIGVERPNQKTIKAMKYKYFALLLQKNKSILYRLQYKIFHFHQEHTLYQSFQEL